MSIRCGKVIKSALIIILILAFLLWLFAVPPGNVVGNVLAGLVMSATIACYWVV